MALFFLPLFFLSVSVAGQELLQISTLHQHETFLGVSVDHEELNEVSNSVLMAEKWLKSHVLSIYPSEDVKSVVVVNGFLCDENGSPNQEGFEVYGFCNGECLPFAQKKIKVSALIPSQCLRNSYLNRVFTFLEEINSTYTVKLYDESDGISSSRVKSMADLGFFRSKSVNILTSSSGSNPTSRKLSFVPSDAALPPLVGTFSPAPETLSPIYASPPHYPNLPPCNPRPYPRPRGRHGGGAAAPPPLGGLAAPPVVSHEGLWCVAKPSVPADTLQEAMDYACGAGGADCEAISPAGSCYLPDSIVAHASYAFNSYWQKNKKNGGTCGFGGTAMIINSDPSFLQCHFTLDPGGFDDVRWWAAVAVVVVVVMEMVVEEEN
ncbi:LOW QUALITY PROTEIN: hypothetical protein OSB04_000090 [Centaurea solstitialis]|uniref:X8 domain-containing protein n=1 Tax=Centaurea solstitialis TaxID=347529 RepID=A0AA38WTN0_9ASTR|nr:LOW QUALITY PROTEIN: hypothetical protein OSB04_000090 [Centaurea solstitialis]